jgi:carbonic anhydrase
MSEIHRLIQNNRDWAQRKTQQDPSFFKRLLAQQNPDFLWIGCADSRVPANDIVGLDPGELFVHRNVANLVVPSDFNCLSVLQYAIEVLQVRHIIVCGHYGCGGVRAALDRHDHGLINNWLAPIKEVAARHREELAAIAEETKRLDRLCELSVMQQVKNVAQSPHVQRAWGRGQPLDLHGWIYGIADGLVRDLLVSIEGPDALEESYRLEGLRDK